MSRTVEQIAAEISNARSEWLEDVLAGLLSNGVKMNEIDVIHTADCRIIVAVRGTMKYEYRIDFAKGAADEGRIEETPAITREAK